MALILADRVLETSTSEGLGTFALAGAQTGYQTFSSGIGNGNTCYYTINGQTTEQWEVGIGTVGAGTLARTTLISSNTGSFINFVAGVKNVFVTQPASKSIYKDENGNAIPLGSASATQLDITAQGDLRLQDTTGGQYVALQAPSTIATSYTLTMPADDGTAGQALVTDGSGVLSWSSAASGDVYGPASATDNAVARYDGTTGKIIQNSAVTIADDGATVIDVNSTSAGLRITQTGTGNALTVEDSANPDATPFVVNASGDVVQGSTTSYSTIATYTSPIQNHVSGNATAGIGLFNWSSGTAAKGDIAFLKSLSGTIGTLSAVSAGVDLGGLTFFGAGDASTWVRAANILAEADSGTFSATSMPGRLVFSTTADGASSPTERMRITSTGSIGIGTGSGLTTAKTRIFSDVTDLTATYNIVNADGTHTLTANNAISFNAAGGSANLDQNGFNATTSLASGGNLKGFNSRTYVTGASGTVTSAVGSYVDVRNTGAGTLTNAVGFQAVISNTGGGTLTNAYGVYINALTAGTNNYGVHSNIAANTGAWNIYAQGTASNYFAGRVGIGSASLSNANLRVANDITGAATSYGALWGGTVQPTVTAAIYNATSVATAANGGVPYTISNLSHYYATQSTINADSIVTNQYGFNVTNNLTGATNNYGFYSNIASGTGRWNFYAAGSAANYFAGDMQLDKTVTAGGTTGDQTINKNAGTVNFAAAATSLVVTDSRVTTSSIIICTVGTNDTTLKSVAAVAGAGSFTLHANAAATAETRVNFLIIN